jgi:hypothetical protein
MTSIEQLFADFILSLPVNNSVRAKWEKHYQDENEGETIKEYIEENCVYDTVDFVAFQILHPEHSRKKVEPRDFTKGYLSFAERLAK